MALVGLSYLRWHRNSFPQPQQQATAAKGAQQASPPLLPAVSQAVSTPYPEVPERPQLEEIRVEIESALIRNGIRMQNFEVKPKGELVLFRVQGAFPDKEWIETLSRRLKEIVPEIRIQSDPQKRMIGVAFEESRPFLLHFFPPVPAPVIRPDHSPKRVAIIMDDLGRDRRFARRLAKLPLAVTFSILPYESHAEWTARMAHQSGREVLVHIPMQPRDFPRINPGEGALLVDMTDHQLTSRLDRHLAKVPHAVGGNNHMGSLFSEDGKRMSVVLQELWSRGLFFVDSLTTPRSTGYLTAKKLKMPVAVRDVFLDNVQNVDKIVRQIDHLIALAERKGSAVGICHPYPETLEALRLSVDRFKARGVEVVAVSRLLEGCEDTSSTGTCKGFTPKAGRE